MSHEYVEKLGLSAFIQERMDAEQVRADRAREVDDTFAAMRAKHKKAALRVVLNMVKKWTSNRQCRSCKGEGQTPGGENGFLEPGGECTSCDGTGKVKTVIYG